MKRVGSQTISFRELHPYMFTDGYKLPKGPSGRYQLTFTTPKGRSWVSCLQDVLANEQQDAKHFMDIFHQIRVR